MNELFNYLLQVSIISALLYGYYHLALRNKRFHHYNRFYILISFLLSIMIPFINVTIYLPAEQLQSPHFFQNFAVISEPSSSVYEEHFTGSTSASVGNKFVWTDLLVPLYVTAASIILFRILFSLYRIQRIILKYKVQKLDTVYFLNTNEPGTPFSFFNWLFWDNKTELNSDRGQQMFRHEWYHIRQKHSADIMIAEFITMLFWINPFFHLFKKELRTIHEFLADQYASSHDNNWKYAELLLMQALNTRQSLVNPFFHNQIKRRIAMITTSQKPRYQYLRKLLVLPIATIAVFLFAFSYKYSKSTNPNSDGQKLTVVIDAGHGGKDNGVIGADGTREKDIVLAIAKKVKALNKNGELQILLTREDDVFPLLKDRTDFSNSQNPDLFISLHVGFSSKKSTYFEVMVPHKNKTWDKENKALASIMSGYLSRINTVNPVREITNSVWVLENSKCPSILLEFGSLNQAEGLRFISDASNQDKIAESILSAIVQYDQQRTNTDLKGSNITIADTTKPDIRFVKNSQTGKLEGTYNGESIKKILLYQPAGNFAFLLAGGNLQVLSEDQSEALKNKFGSDLMKSVTLIDDKIKVDNDNKIFDRVEIEPAFPGGVEKWKEFITNNLNLNVPLEKGAPQNKYTVVLQFVVDTKGHISDIRSLTKHGYGMEEEAIRAIKKSPNWLPAIQNGIKVKAYRKQTFHFFISEETGTISNEPAQPAVTDNTDPFQKNTPTIKLKDLLKTNPYSLLELNENLDILSYVFSIDHPDGTISEVPNKGSDFNEKIRSLIAGAEPGQLIVIDRILVSSRSISNDGTVGGSRKMPGKVYKVVD